MEGLRVTLRIHPYQIQYFERWRTLWFRHYKAWCLRRSSSGLDRRDTPARRCLCRVYAIRRCGWSILWIQGKELVSRPASITQVQWSSASGVAGMFHVNGLETLCLFGRCGGRLWESGMRRSVTKVTKPKLKFLKRWAPPNPESPLDCRFISTGHSTPRHQHRPY